MEKVILPDSPSFVDLCTLHQHAMRYYRLWIYACNTVLAIATLVFTVFAISVLVDPRLKLLSGVEFYQPTFLYAYVALLLQCGVLQAIGCLGALRLNQKLLNTYWTLLLVLMIGDIIVGLVWAFRLERIKTSLRPSLRQKLATQYKVDAEFTQIWDWIQLQDMCCGVDSPFDYPQFNETFSQYSGYENSQLFNEMTVPPLLPSTCCTITKWDSSTSDLLYADYTSPPTHHTNNYAITFPHFSRAIHHHHSSNIGSSSSRDYPNRRHSHSTNYHNRNKSPSTSSTESEQSIYVGRRKGPLRKSGSMELREDEEIPPLQLPPAQQEQLLMLFRKHRQKRDDLKINSNSDYDDDYENFSDDDNNALPLLSQLTQPSSSTTTNTITDSPVPNDSEPPPTTTRTTVPSVRETSPPGPIISALKQLTSTKKPATTTENFSTSRNNNKNSNVINSICVLPPDFNINSLGQSVSSTKSLNSQEEDRFPHSRPSTTSNPLPFEYYHVHQHHIGCGDKMLEWVEHVTDILFVIGFCIIVFLKGCFLAILRYEIKEMIQKIRLLNGDEAVRSAAMNELLGLTSIYGTDENTSQDEDYEDDDDENTIDGQGLVRKGRRKRHGRGNDGPRESSTTTTTTATTNTTVILSNNENSNNSGNNNHGSKSNKNESSSVGTKPVIENHIGNKPAKANTTSQSNNPNTNNSSCGSSNRKKSSTSSTGGIGSGGIEDDFDSASALLDSSSADDNTNSKCRRSGSNANATTTNTTTGPPFRSNYIPVPRNGNNNNSILPTSRHQHHHHHGHHHHHQHSVSPPEEASTTIAMVNFSSNRNPSTTNTSSSVTTTIQ